MCMGWVGQGSPSPMYPSELQVQFPVFDLKLFDIQMSELQIQFPVFDLKLFDITSLLALITFTSTADYLLDLIITLVKMASCQ